MPRENFDVHFNYSLHDVAGNAAGKMCVEFFSFAVVINSLCETFVVASQ
jgi:hypothetical protein